MDIGLALDETYRQKVATVKGLAVGRDRVDLVRAVRRPQVAIFTRRQVPVCTATTEPLRCAHLHCTRSSRGRMSSTRSYARPRRVA